MEREKFMDLIVDEFNDKYRGNWTIDELVLHSREASMFCDGFRHKHGWLYVPDDIILRSVMTRRKDP